MDRFRKSDLQELLGSEAGPCLSLYMPTVRAGAEIQQNPIRFKNLLKAANEQLTGTGMRSPEADDFLEPARSQLLMDEIFWQKQSDGLVVFIGPDLLRAYRLPLTFDEMVVAGDQFYVKPLFEIFQNDGRYYLLALSQDQIRLLEGTKHGIQEVELENVPESLAAALRWDDPEQQTQHHSVSNSSATGGRPQAAFHGHGVGRDDEKTDILHYFHRVDEGLQQYLAGDKAPLVLAGVEYLLPIYREANEYNYLVEDGITGNPEGIRNEELHARALEILAPQFQLGQEQTLELYRQFAGQGDGLAADNVGEILRAAATGRVQSLIVVQGAELWGKFNPAADRVEVHPERQGTSEDLINSAAAHTFLNNGEVLTVPEGVLPGGSPIAAILRY